MSESTTDKQFLPTYHWSEIASPRFKLTKRLFSEPITVTQTVHKRNQTPKVTKAHAALVTYDADYIKYKLLEVVAPLIAEQLIDTESGFETKPSQEELFERSKLLEDLLTELSSVLMMAVASGFVSYNEWAFKSSEIGITLTPVASAIVKSFKLSQELKYVADLGTQKATENTLVDSDSNNDL